ncbi:VCBS repeat-containing protein [Halalkalibaculum sp. DA3122]|uniref:VCBS repeat-containing protein n=1 Tax=Halalkalibaculum sp. DA3122 TaxID=3373607 RepID=UPI0037550B14
MRTTVLLSISLLLCCFVAGCSSLQEQKASLFDLLGSDHTNIDFQNRITNTRELNIQNYGYFYDGAGVAAGDINNDRLPDLYFVGNEQANKLYLNKGNFVFEDITETAGVGGDTTGWSTGVTMADVNGDGYLDIYVSRVNYGGKTGANQLFINNGDRTFTEKAGAYGLDFKGYSTQAAFFDYDKDGDLDLYLLNHSFHSENTRGRAQMLREKTDSLAGDRLYRNEGKTFVDVTERSGIYSSSLGYGLGIAVADINRDGWPDIYIGNDYHEDDYLYINNRDGTFTEALDTSLKHTTRSSMGNDIGDINNDGLVEIVSLDMLPENQTVLRHSGILNTFGRMRTDARFGYKPQYSHNTLQLNRGINGEGMPVFSDIGFASGIAATDWSWAALVMDMDNDGFNDIYVTNGMVGRPTDLDYNQLLQEESQQITLSEDIDQENLELIGEMPPIKIPNYAFENKGDLTFENRAEDWGFHQPSFSSGAAYADLNNDGSLDLVVNNVNMPAFVYRNKTGQAGETAYLRIKLHGKGQNTSGIGAKVVLYRDEQVLYREQMPTRGFQSSVEHVLHVGLGDSTAVDSLTVIWPDDSFQTRYDVRPNQLLELDQAEASGSFIYQRLQDRSDASYLRQVTDQVALDYEHRENRYADFQREPNLPYMISREGPAAARGDVNGDGRDDLFLGGAHGQPGQLFLQQENRTFTASPDNQKLFALDREKEDVSATFFDANGDGLLDLYVVSGGNEYHNSEEILKDRLYINTGGGAFVKSRESIPPMVTNGSVVVAGDFNNDGAADLFVGGRKSRSYGMATRNYLLQNDGKGRFSDVTETVAPELREVGMVTDAGWADMNGSGYPDLVVVGEWMPVHIFENDGERLSMQGQDTELARTRGLWSKLLIDDFNSDGRPDIVTGNFGTNSRLQASFDSPLRLYLQDLEGSGQLSSIIAYEEGGQYYPFAPVNELLQRYPSLTGKVSSYSAFAELPIRKVIGEPTASAAQIKEITTLSSLYIENEGDGNYGIEKLPFHAQIAPVKAMLSGDFNRDGNTDLLLGGNLYGVKPSIGGRQDASYGLMLEGDGNGNFEPLPMKSSGFYIEEGEVRGLLPVAVAEKDTMIMVIKNDQGAQFFEEARIE